jgi:hypothetical protein
VCVLDLSSSSLHIIVNQVFMTWRELAAQYSTFLLRSVAFFLHFFKKEEFNSLKIRFYKSNSLTIELVRYEHNFINNYYIIVIPKNLENLQTFCFLFF